MRVESSANGRLFELWNQNRIQSDIAPMLSLNMSCSWLTNFVAISVHVHVQ